MEQGEREIYCPAPANTIPNDHQPEGAVHFHVNNPITSLLIG